MKQAIILAAGRGRRLGTMLNGHPKCMLKVGQYTLIEHQLAALRSAGIERIGVVIGYGADYVRDLLGVNIHYIENKRWAETNSLYSLWMAREWLDSPFVMCNSDVLAHPEVYHRILNTKGSALAYDSNSGAEEEEMKVSLRNGCVRAMSKTLSAEVSEGENVGIISFDNDAAGLYLETANDMILAGEEQMWSPAALDAIAARIDMQAVDIADLPWTEIDFPADYERAQNDVWPAIRKHGQPRKPRTPSITFERETKHITTVLKLAGGNRVSAKPC